MGKMSVGAYYDWYFDGGFWEPQLQDSLYQQRLIDEGFLKRIIEDCPKMLGGMTGIIFRTEASGKWADWFKLVIDEIYASRKVDYLPMYWKVPGEGIKSEKVSKSEPLIRCIFNSLWGNGTPEEQQITSFFASLMKWDEFLNRYSCGTNGMAFTSNYLEFVVGGKKPLWGNSNRGGPIVRRTSAKKLYSRGSEPITPFLLDNGGRGKGRVVYPGPIIVASSNEHGQIASSGWCGLADDLLVSGKEMEIDLVKGSLKLGLERDIWSVNPAPRNSTAFVIKNRATGQQSYAVLAAV